MKFDLLSRNTMILIEECLKNQDLIKLIDINTQNPLAEPDIKNTGKLVMKKIFPSPATLEVPKEQETNLRIFFANGGIKHRVLLDNELIFQIVMHNNLWNIVREDGQMAIRPYDIMTKIVDTFEDKSIKTLGVIHFTNYGWQHIDKDYSLYNLRAVAMTI